MSLNDLLYELNDDRYKIVFRQRPISLPGDLRISWRVPVLCMLLGGFRSNSSDIANLYPMWWAIRSRENQRIFLKWANGEGRPEELIVRFDPSLVFTIDLAIGCNLLESRPDAKVRLTKNGELLSKSVWADTEAVVAERAFLRQLPSRITQKFVSEAMKW